MRIKRLEISGFKSFGERAKLVFGHGITIVVGPNGCGKSNIVDAIRWCMGEMSAKHLRGRAMQDVIFAGSQSKGPVGMAEVTLTFDTDGTAPAMLGDVAEVAVTRRLHRDGTSEYLLNKVPVRLRDITDLFLGTGVGTRAYSIIEQGRIGFVVNSKPEERRVLIEEVAGITKFKVRKKAAERRMESTQANLTRVNDIVREVERQLVDLRKAAAHAEQFRALRDNLHALDVRRASHRWLELQGLSHHCRQKIDQQQQRLEDSLRDASSGEAHLEAERLRLTEESQLLQAQASQSGALEAEYTALCKELQQVEGALRHSLQRHTQAQQDVQQAQDKIASLQQQQVDVQEELDQQQQSLRQLEGQLPTHQEALEQVQAALADAEEALESVREQHLVHREDLAKASLKCEHVQHQQDQITLRERQLAKQRGEFESQVGQLQQRLQETYLQQQANAQTLADVLQRQTDLRAQESGLQITLQQTQGQLGDVQQVWQDQRSRYHSLLAIVERLDGYSDGVRALLQQPTPSATLVDPLEGSKDPQGAHQSPEGQGTPPVDPSLRQHLLGLFSEVIEVPTRYEKAVEAMLGERLQYILVDGEPAACSAMAWLEAHRAGRSGFIPLSQLAPSQPSLSLPAHWGPILGPDLAQHIVIKQAELAPCLQAWLGQVWCVADVEQAKALRAQGFHHGWLVTEQGHLCDPVGVWSGGAESGAGLLATRREIRQLEQQILQLEQERTTLQQHVDELTTQSQTLQQELQDQQSAYQEASHLQLSLGKDGQALEVQLEQAQQRLEDLVQQQKELDGQLAELAEQFEQALQAMRQADEHKDVFADLIETHQEQRFVLQQQRQNHQEQVTALRIAMVASQEKQAATYANQQLLVRHEEEQHQRITQCEQILAQVVGEQERLQQRVALLQQTLSEKEQTVIQHRATYAAAKEMYEAAHLALQQQAALLKANRGDSDSLRSRLAEWERRLERYQLAIEQLMQQVLERQDIDLHQLITDYHMQPPLTSAEEKERISLEKQLKAMGSVNLLAIEECARLEQRYSFLSQQRDDLAGALGALQQAIGKINVASQERFQAAFDAVNQMFQQVYPRLFRGGTARLELIQADDLLESGVEIVAMPPGKKLQSVSLLSGGEKALTATALVFAIFLIKPSPFCVLDEVDAPLDEANVGRFNELLRDIAKISQFIVITHNKQTMVQGDRLYGITMPQPGLSQVVAVDLQQAEQTVAA